MSDMVRRLTLTLIALLVLSSFTAASALAEAGCAGRSGAGNPQLPATCPDCSRDHGCTSVCPLMCGAIAPHAHKLIESRPARSPGVALASLALSGLDNGPDTPPPRTRVLSAFSIQPRRFT